MDVRKELLYTKSHEWVKEENGIFIVGLTDFAQDALGDLVFIELPEVGDKFGVGESFANAESVKAVSDVYTPVAGTVCEVNEDLADAPEKVNEAPYDAWLIKLNEIGDKEDFLSAAEYEKFCETEA